MSSETGHLPALVRLHHVTGDASILGRHLAPCLGLGHPDLVPTHPYVVHHDDLVLVHPLQWVLLLLLEYPSACRQHPHVAVAVDARLPVLLRVLGPALLVVDASPHVRLHDRLGRDLVRIHLQGGRRTALAARLLHPGVSEALLKYPLPAECPGQPMHLLVVGPGRRPLDRP